METAPHRQSGQQVAVGAAATPCCQRGREASSLIWKTPLGLASLSPGAVHTVGTAKTTARGGRAPAAGAETQGWPSGPSSAGVPVPGGLVGCPDSNSGSVFFVLPSISFR